MPAGSNNPLMRRIMSIAAGGFENLRLTRSYLCAKYTFAQEAGLCGTADLLGASKCAVESH